MSGDGDWKRVCEKHPFLISVEHLSEIIDKAIRAEWRSDDLWSDEELLGFLAAKMNQLKPMLQCALESRSRVNLGDGSIDHFELEDVDLMGLAITYIKDDDDDITFSGELFHCVYYSADISTIRRTSRSRMCGTRMAWSLRFRSSISWFRMFRHRWGLVSPGSTYAIGRFNWGTRLGVDTRSGARRRLPSSTRPRAQRQ